MRPVDDASVQPTAGVRMRGSSVSPGPGRVTGRARYEVRVAGRLGTALRLAFPGMNATDEPAHSVIVLAEERMTLSTVLADLQCRGIRVVRIHLRRRDT